MKPFFYVMVIFLLIKNGELERRISALEKQRDPVCEAAIARTELYEKHPELFPCIQKGTAHVIH